MGLKLFSGSFSEYGYGDESVYPTEYKLGEPRPHRFKVLEIDVYYLHGGNCFTVALVNYKDCKNHNGDKVMVYSGDVEFKIKNSKILDPHFLNNDSSPIARFQPNEEGKRMAVDFVLSQLNK